MKLLGVSGSLQGTSANSALLRVARDVAPDPVEIELFDGLAEIPAFNPDIDPAPASVEALRSLVKSADGVFFATPEYAFGLPGSLKNALDWLVASEAFAGKPVALLNTAPRAFHAQAALRETLATMAARLIPEAFVTLPLTGKTLDAQAIAAEPRHAQRLRESLDALLAAAPSGPPPSTLRAL